MDASQLQQNRGGPGIQVPLDAIIKVIRLEGIQITPSTDRLELQVERLGFSYSNKSSDLGYIDTRINSRSFPLPRKLHEKVDLAELRPKIGYDFARDSFMALDYVPTNLYETLALLIKRQEMWLSEVPVVALGSVYMFGGDSFVPYFKAYKKKGGEIILPSINLMNIEELESLSTRMIFPIVLEDSSRG